MQLTTQQLVTWKRDGIITPETLARLEQAYPRIDLDPYKKHQKLSQG